MWTWHLRPRQLYWFGTWLQMWLLPWIWRKKLFWYFLDLSIKMKWSILFHFFQLCGWSIMYYWSALVLLKIWLYFSERDPCADAVCRFSSDYCIYDNSVASCSCYNFLTAPDCAGSRYGKIQETDLTIFLRPPFSLEGPFQKHSVRNFPVQPDSWTYVLRIFIVKSLKNFNYFVTSFSDGWKFNNYTGEWKWLEGPYISWLPE